MEKAGKERQSDEKLDKGDGVLKSKPDEGNDGADNEIKSDGKTDLEKQNEGKKSSKKEMDDNDSDDNSDKDDDELKLDEAEAKAKADEEEKDKLEEEDQGDKEEEEKAMKESVDKAFSKMDLSEAMQTKVTAIFESQFSLIKVNLEEKYQARLERSVDRSINEQMATLLEAVDTHTDIVAQEWIKENKVGVVSEAKLELAEDFFDGLRGLLEKRDITQPESSGLVERLERKLEEATSALDKTRDELQEIKAERIKMQKQSILGEAAKELSETDKDKLGVLVEGISFSNPENYAEKISTVLETHFGVERKGDEDPTQRLLESFSKTDENGGVKKLEEGKKENGQSKHSYSQYSGMFGSA